MCLPRTHIPADTLSYDTGMVMLSWLGRSFNHSMPFLITCGLKTLLLRASVRRMAFKMRNTDIQVQGVNKLGTQSRVR